MTIKYKELLSSAFSIVWRNKFLWFFGLFVALLTGGGSYKTSPTESWQTLRTQEILGSLTWGNISESFQQDPVSLFLVLLTGLAFLVVAIFILWLAIVSQGALIKSVAKLYSGQASNFQDGLKSGMKKFWPVFFYKVLEKIIILSLLALSLLPIFLTWSDSGSIPIRIGYYLILGLILVVILIISFIVRYSMSYNVIKNESIGESIPDGFNLFKNNFLVTVETAIVVFAVSFILGFLLFLAILALAIPFIFLIFLLKQAGWTLGLVMMLVTGFVILFIAILLAGGILSAFGDAIWTILFMRLIKERPKSLISSLFRK